MTMTPSQLVNDRLLGSLHKGMHARKEVLMMELNKKNPLKQISFGGQK